MARKPRVIAEPPAPEPAPTPEPMPRYCHMPTGCRTKGKVFARLTFQSKSGFVWSEGSCQSHMEHRTDQIRADGGELLSVLVLEVEATV